MKNRDDMNWYEERDLILTFPNGKKRLKIAESCTHFISGLCGESLDAGRTWTCLFLRDEKKGTIIECDRYVKIGEETWVKVKEEVSMKFRKKPVVIEAIQWNGNNINEINDFTKHNSKLVENRRLRIKTLEGCIYASELDWVIKGVKGEFYPCKPDIFEQTYEKV
jgi:hypothetical protein